MRTNTQRPRAAVIAAFHIEQDKVMSKLDELELACEWTDDALRRALNKRYQIGTPVLVRWGRGHVAGIVHSLNKFGQPNTVAVRTASGNVHHRHFHDVEIV